MPKECFPHLGDFHHFLFLFCVNQKAFAWSSTNKKVLIIDDVQKPNIVHFTVKLNFLIKKKKRNATPQIGELVTRWHKAIPRLVNGNWECPHSEEATPPLSFFCLYTNSQGYGSQMDPNYVRQGLVAPFFIADLEKGGGWMVCLLAVGGGWFQVHPTLMAALGFFLFSIFFPFVFFFLFWHFGYRVIQLKEVNKKKAMCGKGGVHSAWWQLGVFTMSPASPVRWLQKQKEKKEQLDAIMVLAQTQFFLKRRKCAIQ